MIDNNNNNNNNKIRILRFINNLGLVNFVNANEKEMKKIKLEFYKKEKKRIKNEEKKRIKNEEKLGIYKDF